MNPLTVQSHVEDKVRSRLLDMCTTKGVGAGTADVIFAEIDRALTEAGAQWENCVGLSVDNTAVNLGVRRSLKAHCEKKNTEIYTLGCPCHIFHNTAQYAEKKFSQVFYPYKPYMRGSA